MGISPEKITLKMGILGRNLLLLPVLNDLSKPLYTAFLAGFCAGSGASMG
jgi:hypothetical protein